MVCPCKLIQGSKHPIVVGDVEMLIMGEAVHVWGQREYEKSVFLSILL